MQTKRNQDLLLNKILLSRQEKKANVYQNWKNHKQLECIQ